eukprot:m.169393 g.169393  ORF g.169393 m.169393 type:complete len:138 (+) comp38992_c0_seq4:511-924(+)
MTVACGHDSLQPCSPGNCSIPRRVDHSRTVVKSLGIGGVVVYTCSACYTLIGNRERRCQLTNYGRSAEWSGKEPRCQIVYCGTLLPKLDHGNVSMDASNTCGAVAKYMCNDGFTLQGNSNVFCIPGGVWSGLLARCI